MVKKVVRSTVGLALATAVAAGVLIAPAAAQARPADAKAAKATVTIKVWDVQYFPKQSGSAGALGRAMQQIDKAFMKKYPNIKVNHVGVPGAQFITRMRTFVASRKGPDVVTNGGGSFPQSSGFSKAMRPMYDLLTKQQKNELSPYLEDEGIGDEPHYSVPVQGARLSLLLQQGDVREGGHRRARPRRSRISWPPARHSRTSASPRSPTASSGTGGASRGTTASRARC